MEIEAQETASEVTAGGEEQAATQPASTEQTAGASEHSGGSFWDRVSSDPEFAAEQVRKRDRQVTEAMQRLKKFETLAPFVDAVGADTLETYIRKAVTIEQNPQIASAVDEFIRTGRWQAQQTAPGPEETDNPYADPEVVELRKTVRELKDNIARIQMENEQRFSQSEVRGLESGIGRNVDAVMSEYGVTDEIRAEMSAEINRRVEAATKSARAGDKQSLHMLSMLGGEHGKDTLERIVAPVVLRQLETVAKVRMNGKAKSVALQSTGAPGRTGTTANGDDTALPAGARSVDELVRRSLEKHTKKAGYNPQTFWGQ